MKKLLATLALAALGFGASVHPSSATTIIDPNPNAVIGDAFAKKTSFTDVYQFSFTGTADVTVGVGALGVKSLAGQLCLDDACATPVVPLGGINVGNIILSATGYTFADLAGATYYFLVTGSTSQFAGGGYLGFVRVNATSPVAATPVPPSILLFLTALGGLGLIGYRRSGMRFSA